MFFHFSKNTLFFVEIYGKNISKRLNAFDGVQNEAYSALSGAS